MTPRHGSGEGRPEVGWGALWFGFLAGPAMWSLHELVSYPIASMACHPATVPPTPAGGTGIALVSVGLVALGVTSAALAVSVGSWRTASRLDPLESPVASRIRFMAAAGVLTSGLFLFGILVAMLPLFTMEPCA